MRRLSGWGQAPAFRRGYLTGELYGSTIGGHWFPGTAGAIQAHYIWGTISALGYVVILHLLLTEGSRLAKAQPLPIRHGVKSMNLYLVSLWGIYPIVY